MVSLGGCAMRLVRPGDVGKGPAGPLEVFRSNPGDEQPGGLGGQMSEFCLIYGKRPLQDSI